EGATLLEVPYLSQDELLCGGASAAMVLRYWGMEEIFPTDFSSLVSGSLGGMRAHDLAAHLSDLGWDPFLFTGRFEELRRHVRLGRPVITLVEVKDGRFHYVVVTGELDDRLIIHDPAASPFELMSRPELNRAWSKTGGLSLLVLPAPERGPNVRTPVSALRPGEQEPPEEPPEETRPLPATCRPRMSEALGLVSRDRHEQAARLLSEGACAHEPAFLRELAGLRLLQRDLDAAARLSREALETDASDRHAVETLATARYLDDAPFEALDTWNRIDRPMIDLIRIIGLRETNQRPMVRMLGLRGGELLTTSSLLLADRRLADLPAVAASRVTFAPTGGGRADVVAGVAERTGLPTTIMPLAAAGLRTAIRREVSLTAVSPLGQGETWSVAWRWWESRPRVAFRFAGPADLGPPAVWTLDATWDRESFGPGVADPVLTVDERTGAVLGYSIWLGPWLRARVRIGGENWVGRGGVARSGVGVDIRPAGDRLGFAAQADAWLADGGDPGFGRLTLDAAWTSRAVLDGLVLTMRAGFESVDSNAPAMLWPGAGLGFARSTLLRAHPLLDDGVVTGRAFDRHLTAGGAEIVYWRPIGAGVRVGGAGFVDVARTWGQRQGESFADAGIGLRLGTSAREAVLRVDVAADLNTDEFAVSAGWWIPAAFR
ncbi:MAG: C39 family peptidase, partial [Gemmatimonadota bacterium]